MKDSPRIVVIEDDDDLRETLAMTLGDQGYDVRDFGSAREALRYLEHDEKVALILLDLMMPDMSGWQFCEERLKSPVLSQIPVVVLTARRSYAPLEGVRQVLHKPVAPDQLFAAVARHRLSYAENG